MRKALLLFAVLGLAGSLWGADPIIGTWKLNVAESKFGSDVKARIKRKTSIVREVNADRWEVAVTGIASNGSPYSFKSTYPKQGGAAVGAETFSDVLKEWEVVVFPPLP